MQITVLTNYLHWTEVYQEEADSILHSLYIKAVSVGTYTDGPFPIQELICSQSRSVKNRRVLNYTNPVASVSYRNDREGLSKLPWSQDEVITVIARK